MLPEQVRRWIEDSVGGRVISAALLPGATSTLLHSVEVDCNGASLNLVLRRFVDEEWVKREPDVASREAASLRHATRAGLSAPELVACDADGTHCGVPATLVTRLRGTVILEPTNRKQWLLGLAETAAQIHRVLIAGFRLHLQFRAPRLQFRAGNDLRVDHRRIRAAIRDRFRRGVRRKRVQLRPLEINNDLPAILAHAVQTDTR